MCNNKISLISFLCSGEEFAGTLLLSIFIFQTRKAEKISGWWREKTILKFIGIVLLKYFWREGRKQYFSCLLNRLVTWLLVWQNLCFDDLFDAVLKYKSSPFCDDCFKSLKKLWDEMIDWWFSANEYGTSLSKFMVFCRDGTSKITNCRRFFMQLVGTVM